MKFSGSVIYQCPFTFNLAVYGILWSFCVVVTPSVSLSSSFYVLSGCQQQRFSTGTGTVLYSSICMLWQYHITLAHTTTKHAHILDSLTTVTAKISFIVGNTYHEPREIVYLSYLFCYVPEYLSLKVAMNILRLDRSCFLFCGANARTCRME